MGLPCSPIGQFELTNGQTAMHYSRHRLTAPVAYMISLTYASTNDQWACLAHPLGSSSKTKPCQFSYVALCTPLCILRQLLVGLYYSRFYCPVRSVCNAIGIQSVNYRRSVTLKILQNAITRLCIVILRLRD